MLIEIFYSYSHKDEKLRSKLEIHLSLLKQQRLVVNWHDRKIGPGRAWKGELDSHLNSAHIILLLVSPDFIASEYCYDIEMKRALERHEAGEAIVVPIILRPCDWHNAPFANIQALPTNAKPITGPSWHNQDEAFLDVARGIRRVVEEFLKEQLLNASITLLKSKSFEKALETIEKALQIDPNCAMAYYIKGIICNRKSEQFIDFYQTRFDFDQAISNFDKAILLDPNFADAYYAEARAYSDVTLFNEALPLIEKAIELAPKNDEFYFEQAMLYEAIGNYSQSLSSTEKAIELAPQTDYYNQKAKILGELARYDEALLAIEKAIELAPDTSDLYLRKGNILYALKRHKEALIAIDQYIKLAPNDCDALINKGDVHFALKQYEEALDAYKKAIGLNPSYAYLYEKVSQVYKLLAQQAYEKAKKLKKLQENASSKLFTLKKYKEV